MKRPSPPEPSKILEELASEVIAPMDRGAIASFSDALNGMIDFHAFLLRTHTIVNEQGPNDSYALIQEGFSTTHERWKRQYHPIFERAGDLLGRQPSFFKMAAIVPYHLVDRSAASVPPEILDSLLELTLLLFHRGGDWWLQRATEQVGKRPNVREPASLSGYEADIYEQTMRGFVVSWEKFRYFPERIWKWEKDNILPAERWKRLHASISFIRQYLRCSAYMVAAAVWRGDEFAASVMSDSLIIWTNSFDRKFNKDGRLKVALLNPDLCDPGWEDTLTKLRFAKPAEHEPAPEAVFRAIIKNLWADVLLTLSTVISAWGFEWGNRSSLPSRISRKLLFAEADDQEAYRRRRDLTPGKSASQILLTLIRQHTSGEGSKYRKWLDELVSMFDILTERKTIPGRIYTSSTKHELDDLSLFQLAILIALADPDNSAKLPSKLDNSAGLPSKLEEAIITISQRPSTDEPARRLKKKLESFQNSFDKMAANKWRSMLTAFSKTDSDIEERKAAIDDLLKTALDLLQRERTIRIENLAVQQKQIDTLADTINTNVFAEDAHAFPLCKFTVVPGADDLPESTIFKESNYEKGLLTIPKMDYPALNEQETFSSVVSEIINTRLLSEVFSASTVQDIDIADDAHYWDVVKEKGAELAGRDLEPLLLVKSEVEPQWISQWIWDQGRRGDTPKPEDLTISRDPSEQTEGYLATFNDVKVQVALIESNVSYILPREVFQKLEILTFANSHKVKIQFQQDDDPWYGDLVFSWAHRVQIPSYPISRLIFASA